MQVDETKFVEKRYGIALNVLNQARAPFRFVCLVRQTAPEELLVSVTAPKYAILVPNETHQRVTKYLEDARTGVVQLGGRLKSRIQNRPLDAFGPFDFLGELFDTKIPQIFAESDVAGDGSDWNRTELSILGDISISVPVTVFDDGNHRNPKPHPEPFPATLIFTPGALLDHGSDGVPADWNEVTDREGGLDPEGYFALYRRRLLPVLRHINDRQTSPRSAFVTIPGLGCGQFAGRFQGTLGQHLRKVLERLLEAFGDRFPNIKAVYFDPYAECVNDRREIHGISFLVRPLTAPGNQAKSQLCFPTAFEEAGDDFSMCSLYSIVAWDHVSWPGNDYYSGARSTDDGVKAAASDSMQAMTGCEGTYDASSGKYLPPAPYRKWEQVVNAGMKREGLRIWNSQAVRIEDSQFDTRICETKLD